MPAAAHFIDERLLERVKRGFVGGPSYTTKKAGQIGGITRRNATRSRPLHRYRAGYNNIATEYHNELRNAYRACKGPYGAFRFKDWADYQVNDQVIGTALGSVDEQMQIIQPAAFGSVIDDYRLITKPVDSAVYNVANGYLEDSVAMTVTANDVPISFTVDYGTGIITINPGLGDVIRVTCEFDVPVMFDEDNLEFVFSDQDAHNLQVVLIEDFSA